MTLPYPTIGYGVVTWVGVASFGRDEFAEDCRSDKNTPTPIASTASETTT